MRVIEGKEKLESVSFSKKRLLFIRECHALFRRVVSGSAYLHKGERSVPKKNHWDHAPVYINMNHKNLFHFRSSWV